MGLNLAQIDRLLNEWKHKVDTVNQNLLDLYDLPAYQRVTGTGNPPANLTGITQQRVSEALTAVDRLFEDLELLTQTIDRASKLRQQLPSLFISDESLQEIYQLLTGNSIQLPSIETPLSQRSLLTSHQQLQAISPTELLTRMGQAFTIARDVFTTVENAWTELEGKLITDSQALIDLQQLAQQLQVAVTPTLITAQTNFANLQTQIDRDPLGVDLALTQDLAPLINHTRQELTTLGNQRQWLQTGFIAAQQRLAQLQQLERDAIAAYTESQAKIIHNLPTAPPLPAADLLELEQWLARLAAKYQAGTIASIQVGLTNWLNKIAAYTVVAQATLTTNRLPLDTRQELRGRLDALTAKALAKGKSEDPILADLAIQARQVLYTSPTALALGQDLVERYQQYLDRQLAC
jgi:hypothetical protein